MKISNKENQTIHQKCICGRQFFFFSFHFWFITFTQHFSWNAMLCFWNGHIFCLRDYSFNLCFGVYFDLKCHCVENTMLFLRMDRLCFGLEWMISFDEMHLIVRSSNSCWFEHLITQFDQRHQVGVPYLCDNCENHKISTTQIVIMFFFPHIFPRIHFYLWMFQYILWALRVL